ncbi:ankyrin repeat-containing protein At5g02620-like [Neltuma alba]|uniref:ankyrin repeat-containing protein At5g02620-like n=1 Tax=Neltuma alba TaxID=207710 RepID=UPI0010A2FE0A|nr:ankyrin repeat-containing protein At5g02620-like [Prosopis alba]
MKRELLLSIPWLTNLPPLKAAAISDGADAENPSYDGYETVPPNYRTCFDIFARAFTFVVWPVVKTLGFWKLKDLEKKKQKHIWCRQILDRLWENKDLVYVGGGSALQSYSLRHGTTEGESSFPRPSGQIVDKQDKKNEETEIVDEGGKKLKGKKNEETKIVDVDENKLKGDGEKKEEGDRKESALFIAAKNGVLEILEKILKDKPGAIHETNSKGQNVLHIAVEYRQPHVLKLLEQQKLWNNLVQSIDDEGNTILHLAARLSQYKPWHIPGSALQMQWEIKWFLYVKDIMPNYVSFLPNKGHKTPVEIFREDHENLIKEGTDWLNHTSQSCSVVAALIAGVAFATSTNVPGGTQEQTGMPTLENHPAFNMFALTSLLSLCCSITGLIMFLAILTSRHQPRDFRKDLPLKLFLGLSSLFVSIASVLVSFSAAFFFVLKEKQVVFLLYAATVLPAAFYAVSQFPLYVDLVRAIFREDPQSSNRESEKLIL